eukprot:Nk52_evm1s1017 gene=Nk52_evmTU1s1017
MDPKKVDAVVSWKLLHNASEVRSFLGLIQYYRRFIPNLARTAQPLNALLRKHVPFVWSSACQTALDTLKRKITTAPVLRAPDFERPFIVHADSSGHTLGACLMQDFGNGPQPIAFHSRTFSPAEKNYDIRDKENLSIIDALRTWRHYLLGNKTLVYTDHQSLKYLFSQPHLKERQARWLEFLSQFDMEILYKKGSSNVVADALSRILRSCLILLFALPTTTSSSFLEEVKK